MVKVRKGMVEVPGGGMVKVRKGMVEVPGGGMVKVRKGMVEVPGGGMVKQSIIINNSFALSCASLKTQRRSTAAFLKVVRIAALQALRKCKGAVGGNALKGGVELHTFTRNPHLLHAPAPAAGTRTCCRNPHLLQEPAPAAGTRTCTCCTHLHMLHAPAHAARTCTCTCCKNLHLLHAPAPGAGTCRVLGSYCHPSILPV
ncbi:hypothetical protein FHG87_021544 [Trinorchestia longiramus]|nr:hypothetical protein FHG87_021544 [Trinorchestia longiramus]